MSEPVFETFLGKGRGDRITDPERMPEADTLRAAAKRLRKGGRCAIPSKRLAALLDMQAMVVAIGGGSTVEYDDNALAIAQYILDHSPNPSRLPADTDTGRGQ